MRVGLLIVCQFWINLSLIKTEMSQMCQSTFMTLMRTWLTMAHNINERCRYSANEVQEFALTTIIAPSCNQIRIAYFQLALPGKDINSGRKIFSYVPSLRIPFLRYLWCPCQLSCKWVHESFSDFSSHFLVNIFHFLALPFGNFWDFFLGPYHPVCHLGSDWIFN